MSKSEENYIKAIFVLSERKGVPVATNSIAQRLNTSAPSVSDMLKKLADKSLIQYEKYKGVRLSKSGLQQATILIRRHRLWETFLVSKLKYEWHEVHELAEELEHIPSDSLIDRLDAFLGYPRFDPHGDPIPDKQGKFTLRQQIPLSKASVESKVVVLGVQKHDEPFLKYLDSLKIAIGTEVHIQQIQSFDKSLRVQIDEKEHLITAQVADQILVNLQSK